MLITASQIQWTTNVTKALVASKERGDNSSLRSIKKKQVWAFCHFSSSSLCKYVCVSCSVWVFNITPMMKMEGKKRLTCLVSQVSMLHGYSNTIRGNLPNVLRLKIVALVTVEVHARDVIDRLAKANCNDTSAFDWLCQLRLYWEKVRSEKTPGRRLLLCDSPINVFPAPFCQQDENDCIIRQTNTRFKYGYEYLGNSGRLVITPLTDRSHESNEYSCPATETLSVFLQSTCVFVCVQVLHDPDHSTASPSGGFSKRPSRYRKNGDSEGLGKSSGHVCHRSQLL